MSKIWTFGDSYGVHLTHDTNIVNEWFWAYDVAKQLRCDDYINYAQMGISNDYTQHTIQEHLDEIAQDDYVIIISTAISRRWFIESLPYFSNFYINNLKEAVGQDVVNAIKQYLTHLYNPKDEKLNFHRFLGWIHYITDKHNLNVIVIPGFESETYPISHKYTVTGSLYTVCYNEFVTTGDRIWYYDDYCKGRDKRSGHMSKDNHKTLADKIVNTLQNNAPLDLSTGFQEKLISIKTIDLITDQFPSFEQTNAPHTYVSHNKLSMK